jgi:hypothetical protein
LETEADAELGEKATSVGSTRKANSGPAGEAAGAEESGPAGKAAGADIEWHDEEGGDIADRLPEIYREWALVFSEEEINRLPDHSEYDHRKEMIEGAVPPFGPIYPLLERELHALREYLRKELAAGKIRRLKSPAGAPNIFVPKLDGSRWLCAASPRVVIGKTAFRRGYGLSEHLGCHLSSEGIAMSPAMIQSIEDWAEPRSVENVQQFSSFANLYREVAGKDTANRGLGCVEKRQEPSTVLGLRRKASRTFSSSWASRTSIAILVTASPKWQGRRRSRLRRMLNGA